MTIEELDRDYIIVYRLDYRSRCGVPSRFWNWEVFHKDEKYDEKEYAQSRYTPSSFPYNTAENILKIVNGSRKG
jgi:hypothetical protein